MSGGEIILILIALLLLFGSKNLPSIARNIGKSLETFRRASREVTDEIMRADITRDAPPLKQRELKSSGEPASPDAADEPPVIQAEARSVGRHDPPTPS